MSSGTETLKIVIIEDNPGDAFIIEGLLQDLGLPMDITLVKDGKDALILLLNTLPNGPPDLVILDLNLPRVDGYEILNLMKASPALKEVPVVVMTGSLNPEDEVRSRGLGAIDYCIKPATSEELDRTLSCLKGHMERVCYSKGPRCYPEGSRDAHGNLPMSYRMPYLYIMTTRLPDEHHFNRR